MIFAIGAAQVLSQGSGGIAGQWIGLAARFGGQRGKRPPAGRDVGHCRPPPVRRLPLVVEDLSVDYGSVRAVDRVSAEVRPGDVVGLIGPNGAGKSTFVDAVTGYVPISGGRVSLGRTALVALPVHRRVRAGLSRTFQRERTPTNLAVSQFLGVAGRDRTSATQRDWLLALFDLPAPATPIAQLDSAQRRRLELAAAFSAAPSVALVDEPAAGLTDEESDRLGSALRTVASEWGVGVVLIEHDLRLVRQVCQSLVVLDRGAVMAAGPTQRTLAHPRVMASYLGVDEAQ